MDDRHSIIIKEDNLKKTHVLYISLIAAIGITSLPALSDEVKQDNVFSGNENQISLSIGASTRSDTIEDLYAFNFQYSQPNSFFNLPGRLNAELGGFFSGDSELEQYNLGIAGLSQDILHSFGDQFYVGVGLGGYIKSESTNRVSSKFTFGEKVFLGYNLNENSNVEVFVRHYSNGTITEFNSGQNFAGLSLTYNY